MNPDKILELHESGNFTCRLQMMFEFCWERSILLQMPEEPRHKIEITVSNPKKVGDGMNAYMTYQVCTKVILFVLRIVKLCCGL